MEFKIHCQHPVSLERKTFVYDNLRSLLVDAETLFPAILSEKLLNKLRSVPLAKVATVERFDANHPISKDGHKLSKILIKLGSACNFECGYCRQRLSQNPVGVGAEKAQAFLSNLPSWYHGGDDGLGGGTRFEFWGGEPFVYWKTLKPLADGLRERYPHATFSVTTNGSLLDLEKVAWLDRLGFYIVISHDGPGQDVRGKDPLKNPVTLKAILSLYQRLKPSRRIGFNAVLNQRNSSLAAIREFFVRLTGDPDVSCGAGSLADPLGESGCDQSFEEGSELEYRMRAFEDLRDGVYANFDGIAKRLSHFMQSLALGINADTIGGKCGMHRPDHIAVDLDGNVTTCNNTNHDEPAGNGKTHAIGLVHNLSEVRVDTMFHWSTRAKCGECPMLHICKGGCPYLTGGDWESACVVAFTDSVPIFCAGLEFLTGYIPYRIEAPHLPEAWKDLLGRSTAKIGNETNSAPRIYPIRYMATI